LHTILHRTDLIVSPLTLQTITTSPMMSIWGKGAEAVKLRPSLRFFHIPRPQALPYTTLCRIMWKRDVIRRTGSTKHTALSSEDDRPTARAETFVKFDLLFFCNMRAASGQTDRHDKAHRQFIRKYYIILECYYATTQIINTKKSERILLTMSTE